MNDACVIQRFVGFDHLNGLVSMHVSFTNLNCKIDLNLFSYYVVIFFLHNINYVKRGKKKYINDV